MRAILALADGKVFEGESAGVGGECIGEVIVNTAVVGYQEMMTDPASCGKILVFTYPLIGNYGVAPKFNESKKAWIAGVVMREKSNMYSNWQARISLDDFMKDQKVIAVTGIDTRTLTVHLRNKGQMLGVISTKEFDTKKLLLKIEEYKKQESKTLLQKISVTKPKKAGNGKINIAILDLGLTQSIMKQLENLSIAITVLPYKVTASEILRFKPKGLIISGGPEEDAALKEVSSNIKPLIGKLPIMGISTGCQVLARALGAKINKMKLGHRGVNYPIYHPNSFKGEITVQNHSCVVDTDSLSKIKSVEITRFNLNDRTVEQIESKKLKLLGIQYIPASPGFSQTHPIFKKFMKMLGGK